MTKLHGIMAEEAARKGAIPFARFMELALYCPNSGYYERPETAPGRSGDFFTSVSVGGVFGELLAFQFAEWLAQLPPPAGSRQLAEAGAHDGRLAADILRWLQARRPTVLNDLEYWIIEPSAARRESQRKTLAEFEPFMRWFDSWEDVPAPGVTGVIFSNELLDAMPVHRIGWDAKRREWFEWGVTVRDGAFAWAKLPVGDDALPFLPKLPAELLDVLPDEFTTEVCPAAADWWRRAARMLRAGKLLALDYGLTGEQFFSPERSRGTLRAYHHHQVNTDLLARPGEQDLTAHVNFSAIQAAGESEGLRTDAFQTQGQFLTGILRTIEARGADANFGDWTPKRLRQFQTLTHPEHLGRSFRALVQGR